MAQPVIAFPAVPILASGRRNLLMRGAKVTETARHTGSLDRSAGYVVQNGPPLTVAAAASLHFALAAAPTGETKPKQTKSEQPKHARLRNGCTP